MQTYIQTEKITFSMLNITNILIKYAANNSSTLK